MTQTSGKRKGKAKEIAAQSRTYRMKETTGAFLARTLNNSDPIAVATCIKEHSLNAVTFFSVKSNYNKTQNTFPENTQKSSFSHALYL